jgi:Tyrosine phosphatase family
LTSIEARCGSIAGYLRDELAVTEQTLQRLHESLTE